MYSHALRKYTFLLRTSFAAKVAYPLDVLTRTFFFAMVLFIFAELWGALLGGDSITGFTRLQLVWYLMVTESIMLSNSRIERRIEEEVKSGALAYTLVRPLHFIWYQCSVYFGETLGQLLFNVLIGSLVAILLVGMPELSFLSVPAILLVVLLAFLLQFLIKMSIALLAFWVEDVNPFFWIYSKVLFTLGGLFVPLDLYPEWLKNIAAALPFNYILYAPARLFVSFDFSTFARVIAAQITWAAILMAITFYVFGRGVKQVNVNGG